MPVNYSGWLSQFFCPCALCPNIPGKCQTTLVSDRSPDTHQRLLRRLLGHLHQLSTRRNPLVTCTLSCRRIHGPPLHWVHVRMCQQDYLGHFGHQSQELWLRLCSPTGELPDRPSRCPASMGNRIKYPFKPAASMMDGWMDGWMGHSLIGKQDEVMHLCD